MGTARSDRTRDRVQRLLITPAVSFFNNFGLVGVREFLMLEDCQNLRNEIAEASISPVTIR